MQTAPTDIKLKKAEGVLEITWSGEASRRHRVRQLRCECSCAACVDEMTGVRTLDVSTIPDDIGITDMALVGNYAVRFTFTDGHDTGIYSWDRLYGLTSAP